MTREAVLVREGARSDRANRRDPLQPVFNEQVAHLCDHLIEMGWGECFEGDGGAQAEFAIARIERGTNPLEGERRLQEPTTGAVT